MRKYLTSLKREGGLLNVDGKGIERELGYYVAEGRKVKRELGEFMEYDFEEMANRLAAAPGMCLSPGFRLEVLRGAQEDRNGIREVTSQKMNVTSQESFRSQGSAHEKSRATLKPQQRAPVKYPSKPSCESLNFE